MTDPLQITKDTLYLSIEELEQDLSAFIHYLKNHNPQGRDRASYWCLIPHQLTFSFSKEVDDYRIEKEVFSRTLKIVSRDVPDSEKDQRRAELYGLFVDAITDNQIRALTRLLKTLKPESRERIRQAYEFQSDAKGTQEP